MTQTDYKEVLATLRNRLRDIDGERSELEVHRADLDNEASNIKATIAKLLPLCGETATPDDLSGLGITDAVLKIVELARPERLSAQQVKERLAEKGFELSGYSNPMASIYKILSRLEEKKRIEVEREGMNSFYRAKRKIRLFRHAAPQPPPVPLAGVPEPPPIPSALKGLGGFASDSSKTGTLKTLLEKVMEAEKK
jgi:hypothetical protein